MLITRKTSQFPSLKTLGIAVEYFPNYVNRKVALHGIDVVLVSFIIKGHGKHILGNEIYLESGGSLAVTNYGQQHDIITDRGGMEIINLYLNLKIHPLPSLPEELQPVLPFFLPLHRNFQHQLNRIVRLKLDEPKLLADLLLAIRRELEAQERGYPEVVAMLFKYFLILCCRQALKSGFVSEDSATHPHRVLEDLRGYLDTHYAEMHTLESLAKRTRMSKTYLCRAFKAYTGKSVFDYLIERRIQSAMMHLRGGDDKIITVALECGFNDLSYFNRKFKSLVGISPHQYRNPDSKKRPTKQGGA